MTSGNKENVLYFQPEDLTALKDQMKMLTAIVMELEEKSKQNKAWVSVTIWRQLKQNRFGYSGKYQLKYQCNIFWTGRLVSYAGWISLSSISRILEPNYSKWPPPMNARTKIIEKN